MSLRAAVLGHPIGHSKSPALHLAAYAQLGADIGYSAIDVTEESLPAFMGTRTSAAPNGGWRGLSVTMPLKTAMVAEVDEVRGVARALGVINTVAFEGDGGSPSGASATTPTSRGSSTPSATPAPRTAPRPSFWAAAELRPRPWPPCRNLARCPWTCYVRNTGAGGRSQGGRRGLGMDITVHSLAGAVAAMAACRRRNLHAAAAGGGRDGGGTGSAGGGAPTASFSTSPTTPGPAESPPPGRKAAERWSPDWRCCSTRPWSRSAISRAWADAGSAEVIDVMCDAVGAPRRVF